MHVMNARSEQKRRQERDRRQHLDFSTCEHSQSFYLVHLRHATTCLEELSQQQNTRAKQHTHRQFHTDTPKGKLNWPHTSVLRCILRFTDSGSCYRDLGSVIAY